MYFFLKGPMETIHLNAFGTKKYCETYGETIYNVSKDMGPIPEAWLMKTDEDKAKVTTFLKVYQISIITQTQTGMLVWSVGVIINSLPPGTCVLH